MTTSIAFRPDAKNLSEVVRNLVLGHARAAAQNHEAFMTAVVACRKIAREKNRVGRLRHVEAVEVDDLVIFAFREAGQPVDVVVRTRAVREDLGAVEAPAAVLAAPADPTIGHVLAVVQRIEQILLAFLAIVLRRMGVQADEAPALLAQASSVAPCGAWTRETVSPAALPAPGSNMSATALAWPAAAPATATYSAYPESFSHASSPARLERHAGTEAYPLPPHGRTW